MSTESSFLVRKRDGKTESYRRAILKEDLVSGFGLSSEDANTFVNAFELDVLRRRKSLVDSSAIKGLVYGYKANGPVALAVARLSDEEFGGRATLPAIAPAATGRQAIAPHRLAVVLL